MANDKEDAKFFVTKVWPKVVERLQISFVSMNNGVDPGEKDLEIVREVFNSWYDGRIEVDDSLSSVDSAVNIIQQKRLFDDNSSDIQLGMDVEPKDA